MIEIDDKIVSTDLLRECFACDLGACKGSCCVEGNAGAPRETDEVDTLEEVYRKIGAITASLIMDAANEILSDTSTQIYR